MTELTKQQIARQDFVDNQVFELINTLLPKSKQVNWDIEFIGVVRESIRKEIQKKVKSIDEKKFYPFFKI